MSTLRQLWVDRKGNIATLAAICLLPVAFAAGTAFDYTSALATKRNLQDAADAAALAGAREVDMSNAERLSVARSVFDANVHHPASADFDLIDGHVVEAVVSSHSPTAFMKLAGISQVDVSASAKAVPIGEPICLLALDPSGPAATEISGGKAAIEATNCGVHANSSAPTAIDVSSNSRSSATFFCAVGGVQGDMDGEVAESCRSQRDPYANLPVPNIGDCDYAGFKHSSGARTMRPGTYCGGIEISGGTLDLEPGLYIVKDGHLRVSANADIRGSAITFYLMGIGSHLQFAGSPVSRLSAPNDGDYAGLLFVQHPDADRGGTSSITGTSTTEIVGAGYFPTQTLQIGGTGDLGTENSHMTFVAYRYKFFGGGRIAVNFHSDHAGYAMQSTAMRYRGARLIE